MKKSKLERLLYKIIPLPVSIDIIGEFISYCSFIYHPGIIGNKKAERCYNIGCNHYIKYRKDNAWKKIS